MSLKMVHRNCSVCGSGEKRTVHEAKLPENSETAIEELAHDPYKPPGSSRWWRYRVVRCENCGHHFADPVFDLDSVSASYLEQDHDNEFGIDRDVLLATNRGYVSLVEPYLPQRREIMLDIGCDTGVLLEASRQLGFTRRIGVEPGEAAAARAVQVAGVEVKRKLFDPADFAKGGAQLITMIHLLDHLPDPVSFLKSVKPLLCDDGIALAVVHDIRSPLARVAGKHWSPLAVLHFEYFSPESLRRAFDLAGFDVVRIVRTKNTFPLYHLLRFAPCVPARLRSVMYRAASAPLLRSIVMRLPLGNIGIIASRRAR